MIESIDMTDYQAKLFDIYHKHPRDTIIVVKAKRQVGKSICMEQLVLYKCLNNSNENVLVVSPTIAQARKVFKELFALIANEQIIKYKNESYLELTFINDSKVSFKSAEQRDGLRGFTITLLIIDEAAYIPDDIFDMLQPTCDVKHADIVLFSTPNFKTGFFYRYYIQGIEGVKNVIALDWTKYDTSRFLSKEKLETYRQQMPKLRFQTEYLGQFIDGEGSIFSNINNCILNVKYERNMVTYAGIDWATSGADNTVVTIINSNKQVVECIAIKNKDTLKTIEEIITILTRYNVKSVMIEKNSIGQTYGDILANKIGSKINIQRFITTNDSKRKIIDALVVAFQNNEITIPNDNELKIELSFFEATCNSNGTIRYNAKNGYHDDRVMSLAFAYKLVNNNKIIIR